MNILDGVTATTTELNYVDGVTSAIQTQLDSKLATGSAIDSGTSNITTGGILTIDVDGTAIGSAGSLTLGAGNDDAGLYVSSDNLVIENVTQDKDIIFKVNDGGSATTVATVDGDVGLFNVEANKLAINGICNYFHSC